jgi:hypothetical protein
MHATGGRACSVLDARTPTHEHARTQEWKDACCAYAWVYLHMYARACAHTCTRAHADSSIYPYASSYVSIHPSIDSNVTSIHIFSGRSLLQSIYVFIHTHIRGEVRILSYICLRINARCGVCVSAIRRRETPLHYAAIRGHAAMANALLTHGADVHAKTDYGCGGQSPLWATVGVRRAGRGRPGLDRCNAVLGAQTHTRDLTLAHTPARIDVAVCMRRNTHTDARTKARARTCAQPRGATHARQTTAALTPPDLTHTHAHLSTRSRTQVWIDARMYGCIVIWACGRVCMRAHMRARARRLAHHPQSDERTRTHTHAGAATHAVTRMGNSAQ